MSGYTDAFNALGQANITGAVGLGYRSGAGMGAFFDVFLILVLIIPIYMKTESYEMTGLTLMILAAAGMVHNIQTFGGSVLGNLNIVALFGVFVAFGFTLTLLGLMGKKE